MAFGINRKQLNDWKKQVLSGEIAFLTHYWQDERFPECYTVTKVGCSELDKLIAWGRKYDLQPKWIHRGKYPHFDLMGKIQYEILTQEGLWQHLDTFQIKPYERKEKAPLKSGKQ